MPLTITEALAEIKTIGKRIEKKRESIMQYIARMDQARDPLQADGGSSEFVCRERQAIGDLENRIVALRRGIQRANDTEAVAINGTSRSIADWLVWRRDVVPGYKATLNAIRGGLNQLREQAKRQGNKVLDSPGAGTPGDIVVNVNEKDLADEIEALEEILGTLDGQLSLKNATVLIQD